MAHTAKGSLAELIQAIEERGLPMVGALKAQLNSIFEQMVNEQAMRDFDAGISESLNAAAPDCDDAYMTLAKVLDRAFDQASGGKGKDRHDEDVEDFEAGLVIVELDEQSGPFFE